MYLEHKISQLANGIVAKILTDHDNTSSETLCGQGHDADLRGNFADCFTFILCPAELRDERVGGVRDDGTDDTSEVPRGKCNSELCFLSIGFFRFCEDVGVEELHDLLKEEELGHGVRDLRDVVSACEASVGRNLQT